MYDRARAAAGVVEGPVQRHFLDGPMTDMGHGPIDAAWPSRIESAGGRFGGQHEELGPSRGREAGEVAASALPCNLHRVAVRVSRPPTAFPSGNGPLSSFGQAGSV